MNKIKLFFSVSCILSILLIVGCKSQTIANNNMNLDGTTWNVIAINDSILPETLKIPFISFDLKNNRISGNTGCNGMNAAVEIQPNSNKIALSEAISTRMACINMNVERDFLENLQKATYFSINNDILVLSDDTHPKLITFKLRK